MDYSFTDNGERKQALASIHRVVVKVGTRLLMGDGNLDQAERIHALVDELVLLRQRGIEVILVSSGAIGAGLTLLGTSQRPSDVPSLQAHAAVGQSQLMFHYSEACKKHDFHCAQLLLVGNDVAQHDRNLNLTNCIEALLKRNALPVINENDSVSIAEICFGDNDSLAAKVATMIRADLTILLTTVDGMYRPEENGRKTRISVVRECSETVLQMATGTDGNAFSTGGMQTKLAAAQEVTRAGESLYIADGRDFSMLGKIFDGEDVGTLFPARPKSRMSRQKRFVAFHSRARGSVSVDAGAERALVENGKSLLPSGIVSVHGNFHRGDTIRVLNEHGREIARGTTNFSAVETDRIRGHKSSETPKILGVEICFDEIIHRDHLALTD